MKPMPLSILGWALLLALPGAAASEERGTLVNPILFVTQVPLTGDFTTISSTFGSHRGALDAAPRGGDLMLLQPSGALRNLTREAGFGMVGFQGANGIAVRDPDVHPDGTRALFSMVIGGATQPFQQGEYFWQIYELSGFAPGQTLSIVRLNQPANFNNVNPAYAPDGSVVFTSDRPRNGAAHLYPQHDEYESAPTNTGLWKLDRASGQVTLLQQSVSGSFDPFFDSFGRLVYVRWDHLQTDQQASVAGNPYGNFDYVSEAANAAIAPTMTEIFPEPRIAPAGSPFNGHEFNVFLPWAIHLNGSDEETLNHLGRHELVTYFNRNRNDDPNLTEFLGGPRPNQNPVVNVLQLTEDATQPGRYLAIDAPEFGVHASGQIVSFDSPPSANADDFQMQYLTPRSTFNTLPAADATGRYRNPTVLANGDVLVAHSTEIGPTQNLGTVSNPVPNHLFRIKRLAPTGGFLAPAETLTNGINASVNYWSPDIMVSYSGPLWELQPVEVRARTAPPLLPERPLAAPEQSIFTNAGVDPALFRQFLRQRGLGVIVVRNTTARDHADKQQPYNLRVPGGTQTLGSGGTIYDIAHFQIFQADQLRGIGGIAQPRPGRRVLARALHEPDAIAHNVPNPGGPEGSVAIAADGSVAAFVPAQRALSWQQSAPDGSAVVRERFWLTVAPGEVRVCEGCHGINRSGQAGQSAPQNPPQALAALLQRWQQLEGDQLHRDGFE